MTKEKGIVLAYFVRVEYRTPWYLGSGDDLEDSPDAFGGRIAVISGIL